MSGSRRLERDGETATCSTPLDKYLARPRQEQCSWYHFASKNGKVPFISGGATHATWPLNEDYCRTMLLLHWPNWFDIQEVKGDAESWIDRFTDFICTAECPTFVKAQVSKAQRYAEHPQEPVFEEDLDEDAAVAEEQPDWVDVYAGENQIFEGVERDLDYDDGGEEYDWSSTCIMVPEGEDPKMWLQESIKEDEEQEMETEDLELPQVSLSSLNENQRAIVSLVLHTLYNFVENQEHYHPLRLVVSGTVGTGKSYVIRCLQRLVRQVFGSNGAIQVITPTGNAAYLVQGSTAYSFLGIPTGARSCNELTVPSGPVLEKIQNKCENLKVHVGDERSMFGRTTMGWMEQHTRYAINRGANADELWGGIPVAVFMGDDVQLPPVCDTAVYIQHCRSAPSNHGRLVWTTFDSAVELTQIVRQTESEQQLRDVLMSLRTYSTTPQQIHCLQKFQWHNLRLTHGPELLGRMDEQGLFVFPTHRLEWERNKVKLLEWNRKPNHPVARIKALDNGRHAQKADRYKGPPYINEDSTVVPIVPVSRCTDCSCRCKRLQVPLRLAWGTTIHKCQGMTVGNGEAFRYVVIHPGKHDFEAKNPGALFVALSRAKSAGGEGRDPDFAFHEDVLINDDRFKPVKTPTTWARAVEMERLHVLASQCRQREPLAPA
ncbi:ATP-dependent DNA helicase PIF6-like [Montipora capricornis]|uniref:ATP-dependent DNA helicase PIF6-like n=1 Tax=Montipora capricornis TaxID=246305 RepID=UPI0035F2053F